MKILFNKIITKTTKKLDKIINLKVTKFKPSTIIKKNLQFSFLLILILISIISTQIYNLNKKKINQNYINLINNSYFKKNLKYFFENLEPRYVDIEHIVSKG